MLLKMPAMSDLLWPKHRDSKGRGGMSARFTLLIVCDDNAGCSAFHDHLRDTGFRVLTAHNTGSAVTCLCNRPVDGVLICQNDVQLGSIIGRGLKPLFPSIPVLLISTGSETVVPPSGIAAVCYTSSLDDEMAGVIAMLFHELRIEGPHRTNASLEQVDGLRRPFLVQGP
jgi:hypothetical protein